MPSRQTRSEPLCDNREATRVDALAIDVRIPFDQVADQIEATDRKLRTLGEATDARIAALSSAIGEHLRAGHPQQ
jgi:hypothetical protein